MSPTPDVIDRVNRAAMHSSGAVAQYARQSELNRPEQVVLDSIAAEARGRAILDIGVGGGRTVAALTAISDDYLGIDYEPRMLEVCTRRFPTRRFEHADARDLAKHADGSFFLVVFSCNGLGMVGHEDRLAIVREVFRVLAPGGIFVFSTHNQHAPEHDGKLRLPDFEPGKGALRFGVHAVRFAARTAIRVFNRYRYSRLDQRGAEYSIINDASRNYGTMLYYISLENQRKQLEQLGFAPGSLAYDLRGDLITADTTDDSILLLARKPEARAGK